MNLLKEFIDYLEEQLRTHGIYVWAAQGEMKPTITEAWIRKKETSTSNADRAIKFWKKQVAAGYGDVLRAFDCSGLGMYWIQNIKKISSSDRSSDGMMRKCVKITKSQLRKGDWVFRIYSSGKAYHIGYVVDDALNVIEAKGRDDGVCKRSLNASGSSYWNAFGRPIWVFPELKDDPDPVPDPDGKWVVSRVLKRTNPAMSGADVKELKARLLALGYLSSNTKDTFGDDTERAVRAYQQAKKLTVDGKAGRDTITALGGVWNG